MAPLSLFFLSLAFGQLVVAEILYYRAYDGVQITEEEYLARDDDYQFWCVNEFESGCPLDEYRRFDGSCNNVDNPLAGAGHFKFERLMDSTDYRFEASGRIDGGAAKVRRIRTQAVAEGEVPSRVFTQWMILYSSFVVKDIAIMLRQDALAYIYEHPNCCTVRDADPLCYPLDIPADDPIHRFSGLNCMNLTYPANYVSKLCVPDAGPFTVPERINFGSPVFDLSQMYGNDRDVFNSQRLFTGGLLNTTTAEGSNLPWPTLIPQKYDRNDGGRTQSAPLFQGLATHWREHNRIAKALAVLNPCWDDDKLFYAARDINIGLYNQVVYYELWPALFGYENLLAEGIISSDAGFRDVYDGGVPEQYAESLYALRWIHSMIEGRVKSYASNGTYLEKQYDIPTLPLKWDLTKAPSSTSMAGLNQGAFRQAAAVQDNILDPLIAERATSNLQVVSDLGSIDISKGRMLGMPKYDKILQFCDGKEHTTWESLEDYITTENIATLKGIYDSPSEMDWIVGMWLEKFYPNSYVPKTVYCTMLPQFHKIVKSDRHWFERPNRPFAFTKDQLAEIRKATVSRLMCDNLETIVESGVTPRPFEVISESNPILPCENYESLNLDLWKDATCSASTTTKTTTPVATTPKTPVVTTTPVATTPKTPAVTTTPVATTPKTPAVTTTPVATTPKTPAATTTPVATTPKTPAATTTPVATTPKTPAATTTATPVATKTKTTPTPSTKDKKKTKLRRV